jgi:Na+-translocating ferredoxin:NAD+ oxidoreductase RnfG subunit
MELRALAGLAALLPASALATEYLTEAAVQSLAFPEADAFEPRQLLLDAAARERLQAPAVSQLSQGQLRYYVASRKGVPLGVLAVDEVIGKYERIRFAVALDATGAVKQVEILRYSESHGQEVRLPAWRKQFAGKPATAALQVGRDIANISGATLSCTHVTDGVRRLVTVLAAQHATGQPG